MLKTVCEPKARPSKLDLAKFTPHISLPGVDLSIELEIILLDGLVVNVGVVVNELLAREHFGRCLIHSLTLRALDDESVDIVNVLLHGLNIDKPLVTAMTHGKTGCGQMSHRLRDRLKGRFRFFRRFGFWHS